MSVKCRLEKTCVVDGLTGVMGYGEFWDGFYGDEALLSQAMGVFWMYLRLYECSLTTF